MKKLANPGCVFISTLFLLAGCASPRLQVPITHTTYTVSAEDQLMSGVETVEIDRDWVLLDGRRLIPREKIDYIRADRGLPSEEKALQSQRRGDRQ
jgi:hypothetical protein